MATTFALASWPRVRFVLPVALVAVVFSYLGLSPLSSAVGALVWVAQGAVGAVVLQQFVGPVAPQLRVLFVLGPGVLFGLMLMVGLYLLGGGGLVGTALTVSALIGGVVLWGRANSAPINDWVRSDAVALVALVGCAVFANSQDLPNLLLPGFCLLAVGLVFSSDFTKMVRILTSASSGLLLGLSAITRSDYWWSSSDDTTTLSAIGTIIVERGRVDDLAGWTTGSHHWLLHAWLALWNQLAGGQIFETYLIAWPLVAAVSMFASLWLCLRLSLGRSIGAPLFMVVGVIMTGFVRLEWPAPHQQQPFLFAMVACGALWLHNQKSAHKQAWWQKIVGLVVLLGVLPVALFVLKPSLIAALGLLIGGIVLVYFNLFQGTRLFAAVGVSVVLVFAGLGLMGLGGAWISQQSFTSFAIDYFPEDLGWCQDTRSALVSVSCVVSLQAVLIVGLGLAAGALLVQRRSIKFTISPLILLPLVIAYLPFRYFISSGVGTGAPSFYQLSEMAMMLVVGIGLAGILSSHTLNTVSIIGIAAMAMVAAVTSQQVKGISERIGTFFLEFAPLRYLDPTDVFALVLAAAGAFTLAQFQPFRSLPFRRLLICFCVISMIPTAQAVAESATAETSALRQSRPEVFFGPQDIEDVGRWMQQETAFGTLFATNYLCGSDRLDECTRTRPQTQCPLHEPALMAGWALSALSQREFYYLSQGWESRTKYYFFHELSTRLSSDISGDAVRALQLQQIDYFVAARTHTDPQTWSVLRSNAEFTTANFAVINLATLLERTQT